MNNTYSMSPSILGTNVHPITYQTTTDQILAWAAKSESRYVCLANVHMVMEAYDDPDFQAMINNADIITPDGMPLVWMLRRLGYLLKGRVCGPALTLWVLETAARRGTSVGFYGSAPDVLDALIENVRKMYSNLKIGYHFSPPFREVSPQEDESIVREINASGAKILFVGLGCPKQEKWMALHKNRVNAVMLGVGAAFDFHAGKVKQAPGWMQARGLEWFFRLMTEPRRLWKRYLMHNPRFAVLALRDLYWKKKG